MSIKLNIIDTNIKLETTRLTLRKPEPDDVDDIFEYAKDPEVARFTRFQPQKTSQETKMFLQVTKQKHQNKTALVLVIELKAEKKVIGTISFQNISELDERAEIGFVLSKKYWSKGLMSEAFQAFLEFGFKKIRFNRLEAFSDIENYRSSNLLKDIMQKEGLLREREKKDNRFCSFNIFSILKKDYIFKRSLKKPLA
ncbi:MAG: putative ribosomal N-acetyltransferase YdaF [Candidatus Anoxychlamydiales bacterium]|nr:putative ribosomal N-acetyltransferase YdaF [Candidatus Anoxychlamydiales bacterium]NGX36423.1 putative ribosomal N-acetyltransferase YdaF [Candidatus Anoxychlamydiales bacterium]